MKSIIRFGCICKEAIILQESRWQILLLTPRLKLTFWQNIVPVTKTGGYVLLSFQIFYCVSIISLKTKRFLPDLGDGECDYTLPLLFSVKSSLPSQEVHTDFLKNPFSWNVLNLSSRHDKVFHSETNAHIFTELV